jgi:hypothetical protein
VTVESPTGARRTPLRQSKLGVNRRVIANTERGLPTKPRVQHRVSLLHNTVTGRQTSRLPHFLDSQLTDGDEVVSLMRRPHFILRKVPGAHFC